MSRRVEVRFNLYGDVWTSWEYEGSVVDGSVVQLELRRHDGRWLDAVNGVEYRYE